MEPIDNVTNYRYGVFYFNKNDIRTVVPKRNRGYGWTLNFAIWKSYVFLGLATLIIIAGVLYFD